MQQVKTESVFTTANQIRDFLEGVFEKWLKPVVTDPLRQKRLENVAGLVGNVLADTDPTTGEFIYPNIRAWINDQSVPFKWREIKDTNGQPKKPRQFAPSDENAIAAIAAAAGIPDQIPVPLLPDQYAEMKKAVSQFLSRIEKGAEQTTIKYEDWVRTMDDLTHDTTMTKIVDFMSACGLYGSELVGYLDKAFFGLVLDPDIFQGIKDWSDEQSRKRKDVKIMSKGWKIFTIVCGLAFGAAFLVWLYFAFHGAR